MQYRYFRTYLNDKPIVIGADWSQADCAVYGDQNGRCVSDFHYDWRLALKDVIITEWYFTDNDDWAASTASGLIERALAEMLDCSEEVWDVDANGHFRAMHEIYAYIQECGDNIVLPIASLTSSESSADLIHEALTLALPIIEEFLTTERCLWGEDDAHGLIKEAEEIRIRLIRALILLNSERNKKQ